MRYCNRSVGGPHNIRADGVEFCPPDSITCIHVAQVSGEYDHSIELKQTVKQLDVHAMLSQSLYGLLYLRSYMS